MPEKQPSPESCLTAGQPYGGELNVEHPPSVLNAVFSVIVTPLAHLGRNALIFDPEAAAGFGFSKNDVSPESAAIVISLVERVLTHRQVRKLSQQSQAAFSAS